MNLSICYMYKTALPVEMPYKDTISKDNKQINVAFLPLKRPAAGIQGVAEWQVLTVCHENRLIQINLFDACQNTCAKSQIQAVKRYGVP